MTPTTTKPFLVLYIHSLLSAALGETGRYTVIGLLRVARLEDSFQALQQRSTDWTSRPGNVRLVSTFTPVRSGNVGDVLISETGEIWQIMPQGYQQLDALPSPVTLDSRAVLALNENSHPPGGHDASSGNQNAHQNLIFTRPGLRA